MSTHPEEALSRGENMMCPPNPAGSRESSMAGAASREVTPPEWFSMNSAPKDGTRIRVMHENAKDYGTATAVWSEVGWICSEAFLNGETMRMYYQPTHWTHLSVSDEQPKAEDPKGLSAKHASAVTEGQTPVGYRWRWGSNDIWTCGKKKPSGYPETGFTCEPLYAAPQTPHPLPADHAEVVKELRERLKFKFVGDCKCGNCHLVPTSLIAKAATLISSQAEEIERREINLRSVMKRSDHWQAKAEALQSDIERITKERDEAYSFVGHGEDMIDKLFKEKQAAESSLASMTARCTALGDKLAEAIELFEMDDEANTPGTDAYTWLVTARALSQTKGTDDA